MTVLWWCILGVTLSLQHDLALAGPLDPCESFPCQNGGICTATDSTYACECPKGTFGTDCEFIEVIDDPSFGGEVNNEEEAKKTSEDSLNITTTTDLSDTTSQETLQFTEEPSSTSSDLTAEAMTTSSDTPQTFIETTGEQNDTSLTDQMTTQEETATDLSDTTSQETLQSTEEPANTSSDLTAEAMTNSSDISQTSNESADGQNDTSLADQLITPGLYIDPCLQSPCANNGICLSLDYGSYRCICMPGSTGRNCETQDDPSFGGVVNNEEEAKKTSEDSLNITTTTDLSDTTSQETLQSTEEPANTSSDLTAEAMTNSSDTSQTFDETADGQNDTSLTDQLTTQEETATGLSDTTSQETLQSTEEPSNTSSDLTAEAMTNSSDTSQTFDETAGGQNDTSLTDQLITPGLFIDPCLQSPCANNGICLSPDYGNYMCICMPGSTGRNCETLAIDENNQAEIPPTTPPIEYQDQSKDLLLLMNANLCDISLCPDGFSCTPLYNGYKCELSKKKDGKDDCSEPFVWSECMCLKTCNHMTNSSTTECLKTGDVGCQKGCQCPDGMVMHNGTCIRVTDCPCYYEGQFLKLGEAVPSATDKCVEFECTTTGMKEMIDPECPQSVY